jgi:methylthioxylose transferase
MSRLCIFVIGILTAISLAALWLTDIPLGISGEWTWERIRFDDGLSFFLGIVQAAIFGGLLLLVAWSGNRRIEDAPQWEVVAWLVAMMAIAFAWLLAVQETPSEGHRLNKAPWVLYYAGSSGYFDHARHEISSVDEFLAGYEDLMSEGDVLHQGTHPPGLFLFYRAIINAVDKFPALSEFAHWTMTQSATDGFASLEDNTRGTTKFITKNDQAVIWLAFLLTQASSVLVIVPMYFLIRTTSNRVAAWKTISFWPFVPAVAIFLPKSDVLFTGLSMTLVCVWSLAARRNSIWLGSLAGLVGFTGLFCSLAFLPIGLIAFAVPVLISLFMHNVDDEPNQSAHFGSRLLQAFKKQQLAIAGGAGCLIAALCVLGFWEVNLFNVWRMNYANHAGFYDQFSRTTWKWMLVNPIEFAFALGLPIFILAIGSIPAVLRQRKERVAELAFIVSTFGVWMLLWISGKNSGEAARLWVPLMPLFVACLSTALSQHNSSSDRAWLTVLSLQALVALLTISRISGFHFG